MGSVSQGARSESRAAGMAWALNWAGMCCTEQHVRRLQVCVPRRVGL